MKKSFIMAVLVTASIALFAGNPGKIITLKGEALIVPQLFWLFVIPIAIVIAYALKVGRFGRKEKDKVWNKE